MKSALGAAFGYKVTLEFVSRRGTASSVRPEATRCHRYDEMLKQTEATLTSTG